MTTRNIIRLVVFALTFAAVSAPGADQIYNTGFGDNAIGGYDTVAYHTQNKAVKGKSDYTYQWRDAKWSFSTAKNLAAFKKSPTKYAPQFGGYCAWALASNKLVKSDPKIFDIHDGKLYLNYSAKTRKQWLADQAGMIKRGNANYPKLTK